MMILILILSESLVKLKILVLVGLRTTLMNKSVFCPKERFDINKLTLNIINKLSIVLNPKVNPETFCMLSKRIRIKEDFLDKDEPK